MKIILKKSMGKYCWNENIGKRKENEIRGERCLEWKGLGNTKGEGKKYVNWIR